MANSFEDEEVEQAKYPVSLLNDADQLESLAGLFRRASAAMLLVPELERDRDYWKNKYTSELRASIKHGEAMIGSVLMLVCNPGVSEALSKGGGPEK